ncbi:MAG: type II toxin-antitoxin system VapC family toxin [Nitrososphaerales archaeon]
MRLYLEPSILVKMFKREEGSDKVTEVISSIDSRPEWVGHTSRWSFLEVARALRKDGKPKEMIELNLKELRSHRIRVDELTRRILSDAESLISSYDIYASDALHVATFRALERKGQLYHFLSDDRHYERLRNILPVIRVKDVWKR